MKLFVGLGNPGQKYARNRHNVGFMALERIADHNDLGTWRTRFHSLACEGELGGERVLLLKPQTYYNEVGNAVREAAKFLKIKVHDIIVFHDEIDLAPAKLRVKTGGGTAGNNGLKSMQAQLSSPDFTRIRIGVGHPGDKTQVANYVLRDFPKADGEWLETLLDAIARSAGKLANGETERFQTDVAQALTTLRAGDKTTDRTQDQNQTQSGARPEAPPARPRRSGGPPSTRSSAPLASRDAARTTSRTGAPSQRDLARIAAAKKNKPSRKIKKGLQAPPAEPAPPPPAETAASPDQTAGNALAARLKRWFSGENKDK